MRVMVALENRFFRTQNGNIYSSTVCDYKFWKRYLQVFNEIIVFARVAELPEEELDKPRADGPNVKFICLPYFVGPWQYIKQYRRLITLTQKVLSESNAYILRIPGQISTILWRYLIKNKLPYGVEVVGDSWDSLGPASVKSVIRPILKHIMTKNQKKQCRFAIASAYVTDHYLQSRYPSNCWSATYSSIELPASLIINNQKLDLRFNRLREVNSGQRPFRICHMGTMAALYKAQDKLIDAVALCKRKGLNIELVLLGDGKYYQDYVAIAKKLGVAGNVKFLGRLPSGEAVINILDSADLFILPSLAEGLPRSLIEAMARGLPCIGSNVGGIPEMLSPEDLIPPKNSKAIALKIESLISDDKKLMQMSQRNLEMAKKYCADELNKQRNKFYRKVLEQTNARYSKKNIFN